jgi:hypothetical protein
MGYPPPMPRKSGTPRTLGMLSIIFGSIIGAMSLFNLVAGKQLGLMMQPTSSQKELFERFTDEVHTVSMVQGAVMLVMSIVLIYIGTGQRKYMRWAAGASVKWGIVALLYLVANAVIQFTVVIPATNRLMESISHGGLASVPMGGIMKFAAFLGIAMYAAFPIILISAFRKPHNIAAMDQPSLPTATVVSS